MTEGRPWAPVPLARGTHGAVVAPHHLASAAGLAIVRAGGSAVDAAIATNAVLAVVQPNSCGIGGDAFWLIWDATEGRQLALNGSGRSAAACDPVAMRRGGRELAPLLGPLSITVPGAVRSWGDAHARFGRLSREAVLAPAIELAADGFPAWDGFVNALEAAVPLLAQAVGQDAAFFRVFRPHGRPWRPGERVRLPALAATLATLARDGFDAFYEGDLAERQCRSLAAAGSPIQASDLRDHRSDWGEPIVVDYRGVRVTTHPPNGSGIVTLELLAILGQFDPPTAASFGPDRVGDPDWIHLGLESARLAMADRDRFLTDPGFRDVPVDRLLDAGYAREQAARIDPRHAAPPVAARFPSGGGTVYVAAVDPQGNAVSLIESTFIGFGSGVVDPDTGVHYHNRAATSASIRAMPTRSSRASGPCIRCSPACSSAPGGRNRGCWPGRWVARPSRRSTPSSCRRSSTVDRTSERPSARLAGTPSRPIAWHHQAPSGWSRATRRWWRSASRRSAIGYRWRPRSTGGWDTSTPSSS